MRVPVEIVVDGVVDAAAILASVAQVQRGHAQVVEEGRIIRARAERSDAQVRPLPLRRGRIGRGAGHAPELHPLPDGQFGFGVLHVARHAVDELFQRVGAFHVQVAAAVGVRVDIHGGIAAQFLGVVFGPFGRAQQSLFLAIPNAQDDGALGLPSLVDQGGQPARLFHQGAGPRNRILRAVHPGIVMVASDDPLVRISVAGNARNHVVNGLGIPVEHGPQMHLGGTGTDMVGDGQRAAPALGRHRTFERRQQRLGVAIGNGQYRNLSEGDGFTQRQPLGVLGGADAGGERVAGINGHVHHAAALYAVRRTIRAVGIGVALVVAVVARVGINQAADGAMLGGHLRLDAAPASAVARYHNGPFDRDPQPVQRLVIVRHAIVDVHQRRGDVAIDGIGVVAGELLGVLRRSRVSRHGWLLQLGREARRLQQLQRALFRGRKKHIVGFNPGCKPPIFELGENPLGILPVVGRPDVVRSGAEPLHVSAQSGGVRNGAELGLPLALGAGGIGGVPTERSRFGGPHLGRQENQTNEENH